MPSNKTDKKIDKLMRRNKVGKNVLVFPCGSEIGLEINRALKYSKDFVLYGASSVDDHGKYVYKNYIPNMPFVDNNNFIKVINMVIEEYEIDFIFPAHDSVVLKLAQSREHIKATIIGSELKTCEICRSKQKTYNYFSEIIKVPRIYKPTEILSYPLFLKPDVGQGSKGTIIALGRRDIEKALIKKKHLLILEYLPNKEYTIDCFTNKKGELLFSQARERIRILNGISADSIPVYDKIFRNIALSINKNLNFRGVWFFQIKYDINNQPTLLEIAPRVAGTMSMCRMQGVNLPLLSLYDAMGIDVSILKNNFDIEIDRALYSKYKLGIKYDHVYLDFDDALVINNKVNTKLLGFIYQCKNEGKKISLITKHKNNIEDTLIMHKTPKSIFEEIISLNTKQNKHTYIKHKNSIFIDDSFAERKIVHENLNIPVFDVSEIVELLD